MPKQEFLRKKQQHQSINAHISCFFSCISVFILLCTYLRQKQQQAKTKRSTPANVCMSYGVVRLKTAWSVCAIGSYATISLCLHVCVCACVCVQLMCCHSQHIKTWWRLIASITTSFYFVISSRTKPFFSLFHSFIHLSVSPPPQHIWHT